MIKRLIPLLAASLMLALSVRSQDPVPPTPGGGEKTAKKQVYPTATLKREFDDNLPFPTGEKLVYEVRYARFPIYATVGTVTFENLGLLPAGSAEAPFSGMNVPFSPQPDERLLHLRATAESKGILLAIIGSSVEDRFENLVTLRDFSTRLSFTDSKEGKKHRVQSGLFDYSANSVRYLTNDPERPAQPAKEKIVPRTEGMMSLLTAIYFVRLQKPREGQMMLFPVSFDEENYQFEVLVAKNEKIKTDCGEVKTIRLEPKLFGPGKFFSRQGEMKMWLSNDKKRVPLRLIARTSSGTITARLVNFRANCRIEDENPEPKPDQTPEIREQKNLTTETRRTQRLIGIAR